MDWLSKLKTIQGTPPAAVPKVSKVTTPEPTDIIEELPTFDDDLKPAGIWDDWHLTTIPAATTAGRVCRCCKGTDFWLSAITENHWTCRKCHPAAPGAEREE